MTNNYRPQFTPLQLKIMQVLSDGYPHSMGELIKSLEDSETTRANIHCHLTAIRKLIKPNDEYITCEMRGDTGYYRYVRLLPIRRNE